jgi:TPR repeat protein
MYATGRGVEENAVEAHMWWDLSRAQGVEGARKSLEILVKEMTKEDISKAQKMASEWQEKH